MTNEPKNKKSLEEKLNTSFTSTHDVIATTLVHLFLLGGSGVIVFLVYKFQPLSLFSILLLYFISLVIFTLLVLKVLRTLFPLKAGVYSPEKHSFTRWCVILEWFLCAHYLWFYMVPGLIPHVLKKYFYRLLGAKIGRGFIPIIGKLEVCQLITIEENVIVGDASIEAFTHLPGNKMLLGKIHLKKGCMISANSMIGPCTAVGENSIVAQLSVVPSFTTIPDNEIWSGNPAKKVADIPKLQEEKKR